MWSKEDPESVVMYVLGFFRLIFLLDFVDDVPIFCQWSSRHLGHFSCMILIFFKISEKALVSESDWRSIWGETEDTSWFPTLSLTLFWRGLVSEVCMTILFSVNMLIHKQGLKNWSDLLTNQKLHLLKIRVMVAVFQWYPFWMWVLPSSWMRLKTHISGARGCETSLKESHLA